MKEKSHEAMQNASSEKRYEAVEIFGYPALFSNGREYEDALPKGLLCYDLRGSDDDPGDPVTIQKYVVVNHAATIITDRTIDLGERGFRYLSEDEGLNFMGYEMTVSEYMDSARRKEQVVSDVPVVSNPDQESNFRIVPSTRNLHVVYSDSDRFGKDASVFVSNERMECVDYIMQRKLDISWRFYIIPDLATWAKMDVPNTPFERYDTLDEAQARFEALRDAAVNDLDDDMAHLTLGIESLDQMSATDILHVRDGKNCLVDDFTRMTKINTSKNALEILSQVADRIGFSHVREYLRDEDGRYMPPNTVAFPMWRNAYFPVKDPQAAIEREFGEQESDAFAIYQLKRDENLRDLHFEPLQGLKEAGYRVDRANYEMVYVGHLPPAPDSDVFDHLNALYTRFNYDHPSGFRGHSMSVSDVVALKRDGEITCHYVDRWGYAEISDFIKPENALKNAEMSMEDDYGMIDGIINNGKSAAIKATEKKPSVIEQIKQKPVIEAHAKSRKPKPQTR